LHLVRKRGPDVARINAALADQIAILLVITRVLPLPAPADQADLPYSTTSRWEDEIVEIVHSKTQKPGVRAGIQKKIF
jgi:hypothetical protein